MAECSHQHFSTISITSEAELQNYVTLRLYSPKYEHQPLTYSHLIKLKLEFPQLRRFSIQLATQSIQGYLYLLYFETVEDALDFKEETKHVLRYSLALFKTEDQYTTHNNAITHFQSNYLEIQMSQQGFELRNGYIKLKKITSVEDVLRKYEDRIQQQQESTLVHTRRKFSFDSSVMHKEQQSLKEDPLEAQQQKKKNSILEGISQAFDCVMIAGLLYGGYQLLKHFNKF